MSMMNRLVTLALLVVSFGVAGRGDAQGPSRADVLRGEYGRYRANNDLLYYHLDVRVDPALKTIRGKNTVRFRMLQDDDRIQLDLHEALALDAVKLGDTSLKFERDQGAVFIDFPETLKAGREVSIVCEYSGTPNQGGRFGGFRIFGRNLGRHGGRRGGKCRIRLKFRPGPHEAEDRVGRGREIT